MSRYDFWAHGSSVQIVDGRPYNPNVVARFTRARNSTWITGLLLDEDLQQGQSEQWLQIAIPTPVRLDDDHVKHYDVCIEGGINKYARVARVEVYCGKTGVQSFGEADPNNPFQPGGSPVGAGGAGNPALPLSDGAFTWWGNLPDQQVQRGLVVCLRVDFLSRDKVGQLEFTSAGVRFEA